MGRKIFIEKYIIFLTILKFSGVLPFRIVIDKNGKYTSIRSSKVAKIFGYIFLCLVGIGNVFAIRYA